jgi:hypothetical protein
MDGGFVYMYHTLGIQAFGDRVSSCRDMEGRIKTDKKLID